MENKFEGFIRELIVQYKGKTDHPHGLEFEGCSQAEIENLKALVAPNTLPEAYLTFLEYMGKKAPAISPSVDSHYSRLLELHEYVPELLEEDGYSDFLINNRFFIASHDGFIYYMIPLNAGDNPPVYAHDEGRKPQYYADTFTDFLIRESGLWSKSEILMKTLPELD